MNSFPAWRFKLAVLFLAGIPAFTGYPLARLPESLVPGITWGWAVYGLAVNALVAAFAGRRTYSAIAAVSALVAAPVVFGGAAVSFLLWAAKWSPNGPAAYSPHYAALCVTMLTVVPLALGLVAVIPFAAFEQRLLARRVGVSRLEKCLLMFVRVFNHIVFVVIPDIVEVVREERSAFGRRPSLRLLVQEMIHVATAGICAAVRFIPLWALEISQLPDASSTGSTDSLS